MFLQHCVEVELLELGGRGRKGAVDGVGAWLDGRAYDMVEGRVPSLRRSLTSSAVSNLSQFVVPSAVSFQFI